MQDIRNLVEFLGDAGAASGLEHSHFTVSELRELLVTAGHKIATRSRRKDLVARIVAVATMRVDLPLEDLLSMSFDSLMKYFEDKRPNNQELLGILSKLDFHPSSEARKHLYRYAARQIAETGMFQRVAEGSNKV